MKVLICDYLGIANQWLDNFTIRKNFEIVGTITPETDKNQNALLADNSWDYLLIFENGTRQFFMMMTQFMKISAERVIYALDNFSWTNHPQALFNMIDITRRRGDLQIFEFFCRQEDELFYDLYNFRRTSLSRNFRR